jgi:signal transduction histidine kinase
MHTPDTNATRRKLNELKRRNRTLQQRNDYMNEMLRTAAHDLRNPLGAILAVSELLLSETSLETEDVHEYHQLIHREAHSMLRLLNAVLDLQRLATGRLTLQRREVNLVEFIEEVADSGERLARRKDIRLETRIEPDLPHGMFDGTRIRQVLDNLLDNAIKFSQPGQSITLEVTRTPRGLEFAVVDQGPGVPEEERHRIFLPFIRGTARPTAEERSTGLGLTICQTIIEQHGGILGVTSTPGEGSRFYFLLPE